MQQEDKGQRRPFFDPASRSLLQSAIIAREGAAFGAAGGRAGEATAAAARAGNGTESRVSPPFPPGTIMISHGACNEPYREQKDTLRSWKQKLESSLPPLALPLLLLTSAYEICYLFLYYFYYYFYYLLFYYLLFFIIIFIVYFFERVYLFQRGIREIRNVRKEKILEKRVKEMERKKIVGKRDRISPRISLMYSFHFLESKTVTIAAEPQSPLEGRWWEGGWEPVAVAGAGSEGAREG